MKNQLKLVAAAIVGGFSIVITPSVQGGMICDMAIPSNCDGDNVEIPQGMQLVIPWRLFLR